MATNVNCKLLFSSTGEVNGVTDVKGNESQLYKGLAEKHGPKKALDLMYLNSTQEATDLLEGRYNENGEPSMELLESYSEALNSVEMGEISYTDTEDINKLSVILKTDSKYDILEYLDSIYENGEIPTDSPSMTPKRAFELSTKIRNTEDFQVENYFSEKTLITEEGVRDEYEVLDPMLSKAQTKEEFDDIIAQHATEATKEQYLNDRGYARDMYESYQEQSQITTEDPNGETVNEPNRTEETLESMDISLNSRFIRMAQLSLSELGRMNTNTINQIIEVAAEKGIDLTDAVQMTDIKGKEAFGEVLQSIIELNIDPSQETINNFTEIYNNFFEVEQTPSINNTFIESGKEVLTEIPNKTAQEKEVLFSQRNLVEVADNLYKQENKLTRDGLVNLAISDIVYEGLGYLPNSAITRNKADDNKANFDALNYISQREMSEIESNIGYFLDSLGHNTDSMNIAFYKYKNLALTEQINLIREADNSNTQGIKIVDVTSSEANRLTDSYLTEFTSEKLKQKIEGSPLYDNLYKHLSVTRNGIRMNNRNIDSIQKVKNSIKQLGQTKKENLIKHLIATKERLLTDVMGIKQNPQNETPQTYIDSKINDPESISEFKGNYLMKSSQREVVTKDTGEKVIKIDGELYEKISDNGVERTYNRLPKKEVNQNTVTPVDIRQVPPIMRTEATNQTEGENITEALTNRELKNKLEC